MPEHAAAAAAGAGTLSEVTRVLVADRQRRIERAATSVALRQLGGGGDHPLVDWLRTLPEPAPETLALRWDPAALRRVLGADEQGEQRGLVLEIAAVAYRAATIVALADALDEEVLAAATRERDPSRVLALLARAGRDLGHGPRTAWHTVDAARTEMGLARVRFPLERAHKPVELKPLREPELSTVAVGGARGRLVRAVAALLR